MLRFSVRRHLGVVPRARLAACAAAALALAGCATDEQARREAYAREAQVQMMRAAALAQRAKQAELEDDGLPSQVAPPLNRRREPDDPREPFSPNYGKPATPPRQAFSPMPMPQQIAGPIAARY